MKTLMICGMLCAASTATLCSMSGEGMESGSGGSNEAMEEIASSEPQPELDTNAGAESEGDSDEDGEGEDGESSEDLDDGEPAAEAVESEG